MTGYTSTNEVVRNMILAEKLQLHYYLNNGSHTMDALVRNKCEAEVLAIIQEISNLLGVRVFIESEPFQEGGLKEIWRLIGKNGNQLTVLLTLIILVLSRIPVVDHEQDVLTKDLIKLSIEEKKLNIEKLKKELNAGKVNEETVDAVSYEVDSNPKVATRKSNFYKNLAGYEKVTGIGIVSLNHNNMLVTAERFIPRSDFYRFIIHTNQLPIEIIENAQIKIISPVLDEDNYKWKGLYGGIPISFSMTDAEFKRAVLRKEISFQHGNIIQCVLNIYRKYDEIGNVIITGYSVVTVIEIVTTQLPPKRLKVSDIGHTGDLIKVKKSCLKSRSCAHTGSAHSKARSRKNSVSSANL